MYIEPSQRQIRQRQIWHYGRFGATESNARASQHTYEALLSFNTNIVSVLKVDDRAWYVYRTIPTSDLAALNLALW